MKDRFVNLSSVLALTVVFSQLTYAAELAGGAGLLLGRSNDLLQPGYSLDASPSTITGQVRFERRFTLVMDSQCERGPCSRSQPYWSLVIKSGQSQYLLNQKINFGESKAPEYFEVAGVALRPGSIVKVEGDAVASGPNMFVMTHVKNVSLLMDLGWTCHSNHQPGSDIYLRLWYERREHEDGAFKLRIQKFSGDSIYQIAYIDRAVFTDLEQEYAFVGSSPSVKVELATEKVPHVEPMRKFKAQLRIYNNTQDSGVETYSLQCSQTRFAPRSF